MISTQDKQVSTKDMIDSFGIANNRILMFNDTEYLEEVEYDAITTQNIKEKISKAENAAITRFASNDDFFDFIETL